VTKDSKIPIFIISCNRVTVLQECINSFRKFIAAPFQIVIHDNCSSYVPLLNYLEQLEGEGVLVYRSSAKVNFDYELNNVSATIENWFNEHDAPYYIVTDPDIALVQQCDDIIDFYAHILDTNPSIEVVGPMLRIDDIPDYYPLKNEVIQRHNEQFWHKKPSFLKWKNCDVGFQEALIDTTFGMYRKSYKFHRLSKGYRTYQPYWARHLDWYLDPNKMTDDQKYYLKNASNVSHWGGAWLKKELVNSGGISPIVPVNLQYYEGEDKYSDGDAEDRILDYIFTHEPECYSGIFEKDDNWPVFYHLTQIRKNLLNWYSFRSGAALLEIGAGMGALTSLFCEKCGHVTAVEMSKRRATAIQIRCRKHKNLEIMVGDFAQMRFDRKYDYITVIGVLEYQSVYGSSATPHLDFLKALTELLAPGGKIILAIENRLGLKYWTGEGEDHSGVPFDSINSFAHGGAAKKAMTFDRQELCALLSEAGLVNQKFYYPMPDYKLPRSVFTDEFLPAEQHLMGGPLYYSHNYTKDLPVVADEGKVREAIVRNGVFPFFANSFLIECSIDNAAYDDTLFALTDGNRSDEYLVTTRFDGERFYKYAANAKALEHIRRCFEAITILEKRGVPVVPHRYEQGVLSTPIMRHETVEQRFIHLVRKRNIDGAKELLDRLYAFILRSSDAADSREGFIERTGLPLESRELDFGVILKDAYFDMNMRNCFFVDGGFLFFDQEWVAHDLPAGFVFFRALVNTYWPNPFLEELCSIEYWKSQYGMDLLWPSYMLLENSLIEGIMGKDSSVMRKLGHMPSDTVSNNIALLQTGHQRIRCANDTINALTDSLNSRSYRTMLLLRRIAGKTGILVLLRALLMLAKKTGLLALLRKLLASRREL